LWNNIFLGSLTLSSADPDVGHWKNHILEERDRQQEGCDARWLKKFATFAHRGFGPAKAGPREQSVHSEPD
jgi:hypothetical protein